MTSRDKATLGMVLGLVFMCCGAAEVALTQLWPQPFFAELTHSVATFEHSGWITGRRLTVRTLRLTLSGTDYSYYAADEKMLRLTHLLQRGDRLDVWTQWVPGPFRGRIWQVQRGNEMLVSFAETGAAEREKDGRSNSLGEILLAAGAVLATGGFLVRSSLAHAFLAPAEWMSESRR